MKKGDVGSKKYGNKGWAFDYPVSAIWNKFMFCQDACQCLILHPYITAWRMKSTWASANPQRSQLQLLFAKNT